MPRQYIKRRLNSFSYAFKGIKAAIWYEPHMQLHALAAVVVVFLGLFFHINTSEWCWIMLAICLVWMAELFNTALEKLTDLVSPEYNELAGKVKDMAAGAVLIAAIAALIIGILVFQPYVVALPIMQEWLIK